MKSISDTTQAPQIAQTPSPKTKGSFLGKATSIISAATTTATTKTATLVVKLKSLFDGYLMPDRSKRPAPR